MAIAPGTRIGVYEVRDLIGSGGMGEVYRAHDTRLRRDVALKTLPGTVAHDSERLARFRREAQVLASLNHSNIATIYGFEESNGLALLVLELVEGETLADRVRQQPLPMRETLAIARQIADAIEAAHNQGVVHRDLKPANIKIRPDGSVKVLDFGLAKAYAVVAPTPNTLDAPTLTSPLATREGVVQGTAAYMSPEQATGQTVDRRTDIWAFACVVYEMLTGRRAFPGDHVSDAISAVLARDPDFTALPAETPTPIRRLLQRGFQKDPKNRLHDIGDARLEILDAQSNTEVPASIAMSSSRGRERLAWAIAALLLLTLIAVILWPATDGENTTLQSRVYRASIMTPAAMGVTAAARIALSPDGERLAFIATSADGPPQLWIRALDTGVTEPLANTEGASGPFWSPDSRFVGFFAQGKLKKIAVDGGPSVALADAESGMGGTWNRDGVIVFASRRSGLHRVLAEGGPATAVTTLDVTRGEVFHTWPSFLPDGRRLLFHAAGSKSAGPFDPNGIYVASLDSPDKKLVVQGGSNALFANGYLLFLRERTLMAQPFDTERLALTGDVAAIAEDIFTDANFHTGLFSASATGLLAYQVRGAESPSQLVWFDRAGRRLADMGETAYYRQPEISPDGTRIAIAILDPIKRTNDVWIIDARGVRTRLTFDDTEERFPTWSPDGARLAFTSGRGGTFDIYARAASGSSDQQLLVHDDVNKYPTSWSADGRYVAYYTGGSTSGTGNDVRVLPLFGDGKPFPFLQTPFNENEGRFSPDGKWLAYQSNESGRIEVYVASFPSPIQKWRVSNDGGSIPRWNRDGREIVYVAPRNKLMSVAVTPRGSTLEIGSPRHLFEQPLAHTSFAISNDGQRLLLNVVTEETVAPPITLLINWPATLIHR